VAQNKSTKRELYFPLQTQTRYSISTKPTSCGVSISLLLHTPFLSFAVYTATEISTAQQTREREKHISLCWWLWRIISIALVAQALFIFSDGLIGRIICMRGALKSDRDELYFIYVQITLNSEPTRRRGVVLHDATLYLCECNRRPTIKLKHHLHC
jgi:hypothetical protein